MRFPEIHNNHVLNALWSLCQNNTYKAIRYTVGDMKMYEDVLQQRNFCLKDRRAYDSAFTGEPAIEVAVHKD